MAHVLIPEYPELSPAVKSIAWTNHKKFCTWATSKTNQSFLFEIFVKDVNIEFIAFRDTHTILNNETLYPMFSCERCGLNVF